MTIKKKNNSDPKNLALNWAERIYWLSMFVMRGYLKGSKTEAFKVPGKAERLCKPNSHLGPKIFPCFLKN